MAQLLATITPEERQQTGREVQPSRPLSYLYWMAVNGQLPQEEVIPAALADAPPEEFATSEGVVDAVPPTVRPAADDEGTVEGKKPNIFQRIFGGNKKKEKTPSSQRP